MYDALKSEEGSVGQKKGKIVNLVFLFILEFNFGLPII